MNNPTKQPIKMRLDSDANEFNNATMCNISSNNIPDNEDKNVIEVND